MSEGKGRILVVDDEGSIQRNLRIYLVDEGFEVSAGDSGAARPGLPPQFVHDELQKK